MASQAPNEGSSERQLSAARGGRNMGVRKGRTVASSREDPTGVRWDRAGSFLALRQGPSAQSGLHWGCGRALPRCTTGY